MSHPHQHHHSQQRQRETKKPISWMTPETKPKPKTAEWYWMFAIIGISASVAFMIIGNALFGLVVLLGIFTVALFSFKKVPSIEIEVTDIGVRTDKTLIPFKTLEGFWIEETKPQVKLLLKSQKMFMPLIVIPIQKIDTSELKNMLTSHLKEELLEESIFDELLERAGV